MADIDKILSVYCLLAPGSCFWVAVLEGKVVGTVAAVGQQKESGDAVVLQRMSVDQRYRKCGVGVVLGREVLEFAAHHGYSSVFLGTTAYAPAAHRLYQRLGFCCVGSPTGMPHQEDDRNHKYITLLCSQLLCLAPMENFNLHGAIGKW
uniref:N-acetylaspartate synthetase n=1 Tax=Haplochromis burtoni TaxID=8153 RepID=A0A3Q3C0Q3_HAPBU